MTTWYYLTSEKMTVCVGVDANLIITQTPPVVWRFKGQPLINLANWMRKHGEHFACFNLEKEIG